MTGLEREVGKLEARMETLETELHGIRKDVREIHDALVSAKAGWMFLSGTIALAATLGAAVSSYITYFHSNTN